MTRNGSAEGVEYAYDEDNRLVTAKYDGGAIVEYSYDDAGNLVSKSGGGQEWEYSYDVENRLVAVSEGGALVMAAAYDGDGARVWQATRYRAAAADLLPSTGDAPDLLAYALAQGLVAAIGTASPAASAGLAQRLAADWFRTGPGAGALPATDLAVEDMASRALAGGWRAEPGYEGYVFSGWAETAYVNSTVTDAVQVMASSGTLSGENDELYALGLVDGTGILSADAPPRASDLLPAAAGELPWLSCGSGQVGLMEGTDGSGVGLPRAASYGENTSSVTSLRLSTWGAAGSVSYSWDGRGSATSELDGAGVLISSRSYAATSGVWAGASTDLPAYGWNAEEYSPATGLVYLRARYLSVSECVFTSRDLHLGSAANPATLNRYAYALADPVNHYDPLGLASWLSGVASRISSAAPSPAARVAGVVSQVFSAATSRLQSAVGAVRSAAGSAGSASCRPSWAVNVAGYASHVSAAVIERYCGMAERMGLMAPTPTAPAGHVSLNDALSGIYTPSWAASYITSIHQAGIEGIGKYAAISNLDDVSQYLKNAGGKIAYIGFGISFVNAHQSIQRYYDAHPELDELRRTNNAAAEFDIHLIIGTLASFTFVLEPYTEYKLTLLAYSPRGEAGRSLADDFYDFRWYYAGGQYGW